MKATFTSIATNQDTFLEFTNLYHYGAWNKFYTDQSVDTPIKYPYWYFPKDTAVKIVAARAILQGIAGARPYYGNPSQAIRFQLGLSEQRAGERRLNITLPTFDEWYEFDYMSYPSLINPAKRELIADVFPDPTSPILNDAFWINPFNMQPAYIGTIVCPMIEIQCEFSGNLEGDIV